MRDLIERQAAIDAIDYWYGIDASEALNRLPSVRQCKYWDSESNFCALSKPSAQPEPRWIPCSEGLPEDGDDVIVTVWGDRVMIAWRYHNEWETESFSLDDEEVNAWMPLPKPWKEKNE